MAMYDETLTYVPKFDANKLADHQDNLTAIPSNGTVFQMAQPVEFTIPMNQPNKEVDFLNSRITVQMNNTTDQALSFQCEVGMLALVNQLIVRTTTGKEFCNYSNVGLLNAILIQKSVDPDWYNKQGKFLLGMANGGSNANTYNYSGTEWTGLTSAQQYASAGSNDGKGETIPATTGTLKKCIPLSLLSAGICHEHFPMDSYAGIVFHIKLQDVLQSMVGTAHATIVNSNFTLTNCVFHYKVTEKSQQLQQSLDRHLLANTYVLPVLDWVQVERTILANVPVLDMQIAFSKKKATRVIIAVRETDKIAVAPNMGIQGRTQADITKIVCKYNQRTYLSSSGIEMDATNYIDAYSDLMINSGGLSSLTTNSIDMDRFVLDANDVAPTNLATCGSYFYEINFSNGMDTSQSSSGLEINSQNLEFHIEKGQSAAGLTFNFFIEYEQEYSLNRNSKVWEVADVGQLQM